MNEEDKEDKMSAEALAKLFHETYERLAPSHGYETRKASAVPWEQVPENNRALMISVAAEVLKKLNEFSDVALWEDLAGRAEVQADRGLLVAEELLKQVKQREQDLAKAEAIIAAFSSHIRAIDAILNRRPAREDDSSPGAVASEEFATGVGRMGKKGKS